MPKGLTAYCPIMKGLCIDGHVKGMGKDKDGRPHLCVCLLHVQGKDPQAENTEDYLTCAWPFKARLQIETSQAVRQNTTTIDKIKNTFNQLMLLAQDNRKVLEDGHHE